MLVVERPQLNRPQALDVEGVEILVAHVLQPADVAAASGRGTRCQQCGIEVLQAACPSPEYVEEDVFPEWNESPEPVISSHDLFQVLCCERAVPLRRDLADIGKVVVRACDVEIVKRNVAGDNG